MLDRRMALLGAVGCVAGCASIEGKAVQIADDLGITASDAIILFDLAKGAAQIAAFAVPAFGPIINIALAAMEPAIEAIENGIETAADISTVVKNSVALLNQVSPAIKITPAAGVSTAYFLPGRARLEIPIRP